MQYCQVTPRLGRGIIHLDTLITLNGVKIYGRTNNSGNIKIELPNVESLIEISPLQELEFIEKCKTHSKSCYNVKVALKTLNDIILECNEPTDNNIIETNNKLSHGLLYGLTKGKGIDDCRTKIQLSIQNNIKWASFHISCMNLVINRSHLISVEAKHVHHNQITISWRIGIDIDKSLKDLDLKVSSISNTFEVETLRTTKKLILLCKNCKGLINNLERFHTIPIPSEFYTNHISSLYCDECEEHILHNNPKLAKKKNM